MVVTALANKSRTVRYREKGSRICKPRDFLIQYKGVRVSIQQTMNGSRMRGNNNEAAKVQCQEAMRVTGL